MDEKAITELMEQFNQLLSSRGFEDLEIKKITIQEKSKNILEMAVHCRWEEIPEGSGNWEEVCR